MHYLYLHGFASGPQSAKAQFLQRQFAIAGKTLHVLDLNQDDFSHLTLSRQIQQGMDWLQGRGPAVIIGSSFGGITAAWIAQQAADPSQIHRLVLLAPAFQFLAQWLPRLGNETLARWQREGWLSVYHYGQRQQCPLAYQFVQDAQRYSDASLTTTVPTLILHGRRDEVIDIQASRDYQAARPWVKLVALDADHSLTEAHATIWSEIQHFLALADPVP